ncbi:MAG: hypothetical protein AVDCRST_MAG85-1890 [uncultured Solirubrobacteraceae bacterium]|uniref:O-antigen ligase-related domain-containing protein n=1 Tax=uncultured Solirubrobacteraceae bacterium TaxID=1162706 RepID=A0A6J4SR84_9ACTN|nr:MAG: hypothetical protein AVDCRST_MAG85-1890 [uncultured Solirubrobacteraceae bacterium]
MLEDGGYFARNWYPAAVAAVVLLAAVAAGTRRLVPDGTAARVALALLAALVAWSYLSLVWADSAGDAFESSNQLLLVLATAWCMAIQPAGPRGLLALIALWSVGVAAICAVRLIQATGAAGLSGLLDPETLRLNDPMAYPNATSALPAMAMLAAVLLASRRELPVLARALMLGAAVLLAEYAVLPQSRGIAVGLVFSLPVLVALASDRVRVVTRLAVVGGMVLIAVPSLLDVGNDAMAERPTAGAVDDAVRLVALTVVLAIALGLALSLLEDRVRVARPTSLSPRRVAVGGIAVALAAAGVAGAVLGPRTVDWAESTWSTAGPYPAGGSRLLSLAPEERPDYARVAWDLFLEKPAGGVASGNFGREYDARRTLPKRSRYTHNIFLRFLAENGVVGILLFLGVLGALLAGAMTGMRRLDGPGRAASAASMAVGAYLVGHGNLDWLEEFAALTGPAIGFTFASVALQRRGAAADPWWERLHRGNRGLAAVPRPVAVAGGLCSLTVALAVLVPPWLSVRYLERVKEGGKAEQVRADLRRAADLNPLSVEPLVNEGRLDLELGNKQDARAAFRRSIDREPTWYAYLQLALLDAQERKWVDAERELEQASMLSANDRVLNEARKRILGRTEVNAVEFDRTFVEGPGLDPGSVG